MNQQSNNRVDIALNSHLVMCLKTFDVRQIVLMNIGLILETLRTVHRVLQKRLPQFTATMTPSEVSGQC